MRLVETNFFRFKGENKEELSKQLIAYYMQIIYEVSFDKVKLYLRKKHYQELRNKLPANGVILQKDPDLKELLIKETAEEEERWYYRAIKAEAENLYTKADEFSIPLLVDLILTEKLSKVNQLF